MVGNFRNVINGILQSVISANMHFRDEQLAVYSKYIDSMAGYVRLNGVSPSEFLKGQHLGIKEMKFIFHAVPLKPFFFSRLLFSLRFALGIVKTDLVYLEDALQSPRRKETIEVVLTISTGDFKKYEHRIEPETIDPDKLVMVK